MEEKKPVLFPNVIFTEDGSWVKFQEKKNQIQKTLCIFSFTLHCPKVI
jgi:hypothetical protein